MEKTPVSQLQEYCQSNRLTEPVFTLLSSIGESHGPMFKIKVTVGGHEGMGQAPNKKQAKHNSAAEVLSKLGILVGSAKGRGTTDGMDSSSLHSLSDSRQDGADDTDVNPVGELQERTQKMYLPPPVYEYPESDSGMAVGVRQFVCTVKVGDHTQKASSGSKKVAKRLAASTMLKVLNSNNPQRRMVASTGAAASTAAATAESVLESVPMPLLTGGLSLAERATAFGAGLFDTDFSSFGRSNSRNGVPTSPSSVLSSNLSSTVGSSQSDSRQHPQESPAAAAARAAIARAQGSSGAMEKSETPPLADGTPSSGCTSPQTISIGESQMSDTTGAQVDTCGHTGGMEVSDATCGDTGVTCGDTCGDTSLMRISDTADDDDLDRFADPDFDSSYDYHATLTRITKKRKLRSDLTELDALSVKNRYQCFLTLSTHPVMAVQGDGPTKEECKQRAAQKALCYLKYLG